MVLDFTEDDQATLDKQEEQKQNQSSKSKYGAQLSANKASSPIPNKVPGQSGVGAGASAVTNPAKGPGNPNMVKQNNFFESNEANLEF